MAQISKQIKDLILEELDNRKAEEIVVIDLAGKSDIADYMIVASGTSSRHVTSIAEYAMMQLKNNHYEYQPIQGSEQGSWVVLDAYQVIVHIFQPEVRSYYNLEQLWQDNIRPTE